MQKYAPDMGFAILHGELLRRLITIMEVIPLDETSRMNRENEGRLDLPQDENRHNYTVAASTMSPSTRAGEKRDKRRYKFLSSGKRRLRPVVSQEKKECLATWVKVGDLETWTLWDSGSTTSGITPAFAELTKIKVDTLEYPHILQLGTVGSRLIIRYRADVPIQVEGLTLPNPLTEEDVPRLKQQWYDNYKEILQGTKEELPLLRKVNHEINLIDPNTKYTVSDKTLSMIFESAKIL